MSLRAQAEADLQSTFETDSGFGVPVTVTDPDGFTGTEQLYGNTGDIGEVIDPDLGIAVSGRLAHVTLRLSSLMAAGFTDMPRGIAEASVKPWIVSFAGPSTPALTYKVKSSRPDRTRFGSQFRTRCSRWNPR